MIRLVGDFETSVYEGQSSTEVWSFAICEIGNEEPENVLVYTSIWEGLLQLFHISETEDDDIDIYFHNLRFDGSFLLDYFLRVAGWKNAFNSETKDFYKDKEMKPYTIKYVVSDMGQWYNITLKLPTGHFIRFKDSLKLLPFSLSQIGKSFNTKHKKLTMEYKGERHAGGYISPDEMMYIKNDVLCLAEALDIVHSEGHTKLTIGSCCMEEFKKTIPKKEYEQMFPDLTQMYLPTSNKNFDEYIRESYGGGWCYVREDIANQEQTGGCTADVNSLYPSMMHSESGNIYPVGEPHYWEGNTIPEIAKKPNHYYFIHFTCCFHLKEGYLPFVHVRNSVLYHGEENLKTSDVYDRNTGEYCHWYTDKYGAKREAVVKLCMTCTDFKLFHEHYNIYNLNILGGVWFDTQIGLFDEYINKYAEIKKNSKFAKRTLAKLFLNNLYGKLSSSTNSSFKVARVENDVIKFDTVHANNKKAGYIPIGSAITSYAREFTIRHAQKNYHGEGKPGFCYADTDSIHCNIPESELIGVKVHPYNFNCWKIETYWDRAIFVRQKTYIERVTHEDGEEVNPFYLVKCAGMPQSSKNIFVNSMEEGLKTLNDFKVGLEVSGKLMPKRIKGGIILVDTNFKMNEKRI